MAGIKDFKKVSGPAELNRLQEKLQEFFAPIIACPIIDGNLLTNVSLSSTETKVEHKLAREPQGYIITRKNANQDVWESSKALPTRHLSLTATGDVVVDIWVF